jgi:enoyl-CoA hydratase/carnithine racemase
MDTSLATFEDLGSHAVLRFNPRESLFVADSRAMIELWEAIDQIQGKRVVIFRLPEGYLSPSVVDEFWRRANEAPSIGLVRPEMASVAATSIIRILTFLNSLPALTIGCCQGEVDFDMLGVLLSSKYRMCAADTTFVNRTLSRNAAPGSGTPWFLVRLLGHAKVRRLYLDGVSLTADEAMNLGIVDHISKPESLEQEALEVARRFERFSPGALKSMQKALDLVDLDLAKYLEQAGTGFENLPK